MSEIALHPHLSKLPVDALKEFTEWCILEQAVEAGYEFTANNSKLINLAPDYYIEELVDQFIQATRNSIEGGIAALAAGKQADTNGLQGIPIVVDFISLYVRYLVPKGRNNMHPSQETTNQVYELASQQQWDKLSEIGKKYHVVF